MLPISKSLQYCHHISKPNTFKILTINNHPLPFVQLCFTNLKVQKTIEHLIIDFHQPPNNVPHVHNTCNIITCMFLKSIHNPMRYHYFDHVQNQLQKPFVKIITKNHNFLNPIHKLCF